MQKATDRRDNRRRELLATLTDADLATQLRAHTAAPRTFGNTASVVLAWLIGEAERRRPDLDDTVDACIAALPDGYEDGQGVIASLYANHLTA